MAPIVLEQQKTIMVGRQDVRIALIHFHHAMWTALWNSGLDAYLIYRISVACFDTARGEAHGDDSRRDVAEVQVELSLHEPLAPLRSGRAHPGRHQARRRAGAGLKRKRSTKCASRRTLRWIPSARTSIHTATTKIWI
eukprot:5412246-Pleurochrysis_carterae.AAC.2